jgi:hypothetical protein
MPEPEQPEGGLSPRVQSQLDHVVKAFGRLRERIVIGHKATGPDIDFLYEEGTILVREEDVERVSQILRRPPPVRYRVGILMRRRRWRVPPVTSVINGLARQPLAGTGRNTIQAVEEIDRALGAGVARPNHVMFLDPGSICPATEPEEVPDYSDPDPDVCRGHDGKGVSILIGDSGLLPETLEPAWRREHPWLDGVDGEIENIAHEPIPVYAGHGTFVAGVSRCMAPAADIYVADVFDTIHMGGAVLETDAIRRLTQLLADKSPDIISLSAHAGTHLDQALMTFEVFFEKFPYYKGLAFVSAAGNDDSRDRRWPAAFPEFVSVGALSANRRRRARYSNYGSWVDVYAPGTGLVNAFANGIYVCDEDPHVGVERHFYGMARWSGTSFSTPLVAGLIAARMSRTGENGKQAAQALLAIAQQQAIPGVGAVLYPCLDDNRGHQHSENHHCGCGCRHC